MSNRSTNSSRLSGLTVTCHQCGGSSMVRLDRKEYRCTHCGAITVVSDDDADRLEQMIANVLNRPATVAAPAQFPNPLGVKLGTGLLAGSVLFAVLIALTTHRSSGRRTATGSTVRDDRTVPGSQVVMSSLQWEPEEMSRGNYVGLLYNHSGYAIDVPRYTLTLFSDGMKGDSDMFISPINTLQPGEYERVSFRFFSVKPHDRYEVEAPETIYRSTRDIAPVKLVNPQFVHQQGGERYTLVGIVQNTFTKPISGVGQLLLYGRDHQIVGSTVGYFSQVRPGEKTMLTMDAWTRSVDTPIASYEYLIDAEFH
jgi:hypothetical protein